MTINSAVFSHRALCKWTSLWLPASEWSLVSFQIRKAKLRWWQIGVAGVGDPTGVFRPQSWVHWENDVRESQDLDLWDGGLRETVTWRVGGWGSALKSLCGLLNNELELQFKKNTSLQLLINKCKNICTSYSFTFISSLFLVEAIALDFQNNGLIHQETSMGSSQSSFLMQAVITNNKEKLSAIVGTKEELLENKFSGAVVESPAQSDTTKTAEVVFKTMPSFQKSELNPSSGSNVKDNPKSLMCARRQPEKDLDPLSAFITLRSLQAPPADATPPNSAHTEGLIILCSS